MRNLFSSLDSTRLADRDRDQQEALEYLAEAWNTAEGEGIDSVAIAHAALFAALATLVSDHGEGATADLVSGLAERIRNGEYSIARVLQ